MANVEVACKIEDRRLLEFDWDEDNLRHIAQHDVTAAEVEHMLQGPTLDLGFQDSEAGATESDRILIVITTWRGSRIRVVTAFDAPRSVSDEYRKLRVI